MPMNQQDMLIRYFDRNQLDQIQLAKLREELLSHPEQRNSYDINSPELILALLREALQAKDLSQILAKFNVQSIWVNLAQFQQIILEIERQITQEQIQSLFSKYNKDLGASVSVVDFQLDLIGDSKLIQKENEQLQVCVMELKKKLETLEQSKIEQ